MNLEVRYNPQQPCEPVEVPGSKSIAARALALRYSLGLDVALGNLPDCDDTRTICSAIEALQRGDTELDMHACGTGWRIMTALAAATPGVDVVLTGIPRLLERPLLPLVESLRALGADIDYTPGSAPRVRGRVLSGGEVAVDGSRSSQFATALLLASPMMQRPVQLTFPCGITSEPYLDMTRDLIKIFSKLRDGDGFNVPVDWSSAAYFFEASVLNGKTPLFASHSQPEDAIYQADACCRQLFRVVAEGGHFWADMHRSPDLVPAMMVAACLKATDVRIWGIGHLRDKESDRLEAVQAELRKLGYIVEIEDDALRWRGEKCIPMPHPVIETYGDHRIAMAFAPACIMCGPMTILDTECVAKSFPDYFSQIARIGIASTPV